MLPRNRRQVSAGQDWTNHALMTRLTADDQTLCVLYCLHSDSCVRLAYRNDRPSGINCLLYNTVDGTSSPLWKWNVYDVTDDADDPGQQADAGDGGGFGTTVL